MSTTTKTPTGTVPVCPLCGFATKQMELDAYDGFCRDCWDWTRTLDSEPWTSYLDRIRGRKSD
jgi:hypothetical protein